MTVRVFSNSLSTADVAYSKQEVNDEKKRNCMEKGMSYLQLLSCSVLGGLEETKNLHQDCHFHTQDPNHSSPEYAICITA